MSVLITDQETCHICNKPETRERRVHECHICSKSTCLDCADLDYGGGDDGNGLTQFDCFTCIEKRRAEKEAARQEADRTDYITSPYNDGREAA